MNDKYKDIGTIEDRVIEECAEVIHVICKVKRFGYKCHHPDRPDIGNIKEVHLELDDLQIKIDEYRK